MIKIKKFDFSLYPRLVVFTSSFCLMVMELVAGRLMAPYLGVSLYTWTSIIGVILAGISIGNYLGGKLADLKPKKSNLGIIFFLAGVTSLMIITLSSYMGHYLKQGLISLPLATFLFSFIVFFSPSVLLSCVTPIIIKLTLKDLRTAGQTVGQIYAFSALGSILGTFATGYFLILYLGTKSIIYIVSLIMFIISFNFLGFGLLKKIWKKNWFLLLISLFLYGITLSSVCTTESNYYCIKLVPYQSGDREIISLGLDNLTHSYIDKKDFNYLGYDYEKTFAILERYKSSTNKSSLGILFLGGGGYVLPKYSEKNYPGSKIEVVEIDPIVTALNYQKLALSPTTSIKTYNLDARIFLNKEEGDKYDLIIGDTFNNLSVPYHLTTREFNEQIKNTLKPDGFYAVNIIDDQSIGRFLTSYLTTLKQTFPYLYLAPLNRNWFKVSSRSTYVILAGHQKIDLNSWQEANQELVSSGIYDQKRMEDLGLLVFGQELENYLFNKKTIILTDNHMPVDNLLAPVFRTKYQR